MCKYNEDKRRTKKKHTPYYTTPTSNIGMMLDSPFAENNTKNKNLLLFVKLRKIKTSDLKRRGTWGLGLVGSMKIFVCFLTDNFFFVA